MPVNPIQNKRSSGAQRQSTPAAAGPGDIYTTLVNLAGDKIVQQVENFGTIIGQVKGDGRHGLPIQLVSPVNPQPGDMWLEKIGGNTVLRYVNHLGAIQTASIGLPTPPISASNVTYTNADHPSLTDVQLALDALFYVAPVLSGFTALSGGQPIVEPGVTVGTVNLSWARNKTVVSQTLIRNPGAVPTIITAGALSANAVVGQTNTVPTTLTWTLSANDGTTTATANTSLSWLFKRYWGTSVNAVPTNGDILGMSSDFVQNKSKTVSLGGGASYIYFVVPNLPAFAGALTWTVSGFPFTDFIELSPQTVTNGYAVAQSYRVWRSNQVYSSPIPCVWS